MPAAPHGFLARLQGWLLGRAGAGRAGYLLIPSAAALVVLLLFFFQPGLFQVLELKILDEHYRLRGPRAPAVPVRIVAIDDQSVATIGRWPWPRAVLADLFARLAAGGARVVGVDVLLTEAETTPEQRLAAEILGRYRALGASGGPAGQAFERELAARAARSDPDRRLAEAIRGVPVVLAAYFEFGPPAPAADPATPLDRFGFLRLRGREQPAILLPTAARITEPLALFAGAARAVGHVNILPDRDGTVRRESPALEYGGKYYASLGVQVARLALGVSADQMLLDLRGELQIGPRQLLTDVTGQLLLNFAGPGKSFPHHSAAQVLSGAVPPDTFRDAIVLVGATATGIFDLRVTPFEPVYPGVEIHATTVENILTGAYLHRPAWVEVTVFLLLLLLPFLLARLLVRLRPLAGGLLALGGLLGLFVLGQLLFAGAGVWLPVFYPMLAVVGTHLPLAVYRALTEERQRLFIKRAFQQYVPERVVERVVDNPTMLRFGGERRELTILFSDIRSFTTYSEKHRPEQVVEILREYLSRMVEAVFAHEGTLDKFIGDAVMAIFGAPVAQSDHALRACRAALDMRAALVRLQAKWRAEGKEPFAMGIGINTGEVIVGNLGSDQRFDYTVIGDPVNLAARLESLNKEFPQAGGILLSEYTYALVRDQVTARRLGEVTVKGKQQPVEVYELLGLREP